MFLEAYTHTVADLKRQTEITELDAPRRLPPQELDARLAVLQAKILPLKIQGRLEPSHHLINSVCQMVDDQRIRYIPWSACTTRAQEINSVREVTAMKVWQPDKSGVIKQVSQGPDLQASTCNELDVMQALRRRGIAYAVGQLMSFSSHELLISLLFDELQREPQPGFHAVSLGQIAQADREIHVKLGELTRGGLSPGPAGELPLDIHVREVLRSPAVMWLLMPKQKQGSSPPSSSVVTPSAKGEPKPKRKQKRKKKTDGAADADSPEGESPAKKRRVPMPKQLLEGSPDDPEGNPLCFGYSLKTCKADFHSDVNNDARFHNWIVPLSRFAQGGIWEEQEGGPVTKFARGRHRPGAVLDVGAGPVELPSHCLHCVLPWTGTRCVLVAFVPASLERLKPTDKTFMSTMGFYMPHAGVDSEVARSVWRETMEQRDKHWLRGPFSFEQMDEKYNGTWIASKRFGVVQGEKTRAVDDLSEFLGPFSFEQMDEKYNGTWIASKRFGVVQGEKTRAVDDLSEFLVNASVTETDKVILDAVDNIVATARFLVGS
eukprot:s8012_g1.t1